MRYVLVQFSFIGKQCFNNRIRLLFEGLPVWNGNRIGMFIQPVTLEVEYFQYVQKNTHIYRKKRE